MNISDTCKSLYTPNSTYTTTNPYLSPPNTTVLLTSMYNILTVTEGPSANITNFENCFNIWETSVIYYDDDCYMDVRDSEIVSQSDLDVTTGCLDGYGVPYRVVFQGQSPLESGGEGWKERGRGRGWWAVLGGVGVVILGGLVGGVW